MNSVMIVDDSEILRNQIRKILETAQYKVYEASNGLDALTQLKGGQKPDLVVCDVNMPEMDGLTLCERIRELEALRSIPIIMLTTEANPDMKLRGKNAGVVAWMTKPLNGERLVSAVGTILERKLCQS